MPLSMFLPRTKSSSGTTTDTPSTATGATVIANTPKTSITTESATISSVNGLTMKASAGHLSIGKYYSGEYSERYTLIGSDSKFFYFWHDFQIYRSSITVSSSGTTDGNATMTQITTTPNSDGNYISHCKMCNGTIYYLRYATNESSGDINGQVSLYKYDTDTEKHTKILSNQLYRYTNLSYSMMRIRSICSVSYRKINNANYILIAYYRYGTTGSQNFLVIKDGTSGGSVEAYNSTAISTKDPTELASNTKPYSFTGMDRILHRSYDFGIYDISGSSTTDVYIMMTYAYNADYEEPKRYGVSAHSLAFTWYVEKWKFSFSSSSALQLTQISSSTIDSSTGDGNTMMVMPVSSPEYTTVLALSLSSDYEKSTSTGVSYHYTYLGHAFSASISSSPTIKKLSSFTTNNIESGDMNQEQETTTAAVHSAVYYNGSECPVIIVKGFGWSQIYPVTISGATSGSNGTNFHITWYFYKGDVVKCDAGIKSYILGGITYNVNSTSFTIPQNGTYEFLTSVYSSTVNPDFVVYTTDGGILNTNINFISSTQISGYFNKGMKVNGVTTTQSGYQTISGSFNGRVSITK